MPADVPGGDASPSFLSLFIDGGLVAAARFYQAAQIPGAGIAMFDAATGHKLWERADGTALASVSLDGGAAFLGEAASGSPCGQTVTTSVA